MLGDLLRPFIAQEVKELVDAEVTRIRQELVSLARAQKNAPATFLEISGSDVSTIIGNTYELVQVSTSTPFLLSGYLDLSHMRAGDIVELTEYITFDGRELVFIRHAYENELTEPILWLPDRLVHEGYRVTITHRHGSSKRFMAKWYRSVSL